MCASLVDVGVSAGRCLGGVSHFLYLSSWNDAHLVHLKSVRWVYQNGFVEWPYSRVVMPTGLYCGVITAVHPPACPLYPCPGENTYFFASSCACEVSPELPRTSYQVLITVVTNILFGFSLFISVYFCFVRIFLVFAQLKCDSW